jgi:hypothetical protein
MNGMGFSFHSEVQKEKAGAEIKTKGTVPVLRS